MSEENHHRGLFHHKKEEEQPVEATVYSETNYIDTGYGGSYSESTTAVISSEKQEEYAKEHEKHKAKKDPDDVGNLTTEEKIVAAVAISGSGLAFHNNLVDRMSDKKEYLSDLLHQKKDEDIPQELKTVDDYKKEEKEHKHKEHMSELGAAAAGAFALHEKHKAKKDPEHAHRHKIEEEIAAAAAVGAGGLAFHEKHERKEAKEEEKEAEGGEKHHFF